MQYKQLGNSELNVSVVGLGTWAIGGGEWWGNSNEADSIAAIKTSVDHGITLIDTAPGYGFGYSESVVGKAIKGIRHKVVLSTKCGLWWQSEEGTPFFSQSGYQVHRCLKPTTIRKELEDSLTRLGTEYIDIYHTHWQDATTPIEDTMDCLMKLRQEGKIREIGISNASILDCEQYLKAGTIAAQQEKYSIVDRKIEQELVDFCSEKNIGILAYSPLEQGLLTGKVTMETTFSPTDTRSLNPWFEKNKRKKVIAFLRKLAVYTEKYKCTVAQLIIAWTYHQKGITSVLCGARNVVNANENSMAGDIMLSPTDIQEIRTLASNL